MSNCCFSEIKPFIRYARYLEVDSKSTFPLTIPRDARLFYTINGNGILTVKGKNYIMNHGDLVLFSAGTEYKIHSPENKVSYLILNFDYTWRHSDLCIPISPVVSSVFTENMIIDPIIFGDMPEINEPVYLKGMLILAERLAEIEREFSRKIVYFETRISGILISILADILRSFKMKASLETNDRLDAILRFIHNNYKENITNAFIGEKFGFHPNYISALIKNYTGMSLHKYLIYVKISHAIEFLNGCELTVGEIAEKCGFCDIYYFSRYFKQYMGTSPVEYRRKNGGI